MKNLLLILIILFGGCGMDDEDNLYLVKQKEIELVDTNVTDTTFTLDLLLRGITPKGSRLDTTNPNASSYSFEIKAGNKVTMFFRTEGGARELFPVLDVNIANDLFKFWYRGKSYTLTINGTEYYPLAGYVGFTFVNGTDLEIGKYKISDDILLYNDTDPKTMIDEGMIPDLDGRKIQLNDAIYKVSDASTYYDKYRHVSVGGIVYMYDLFSQTLKFYRKIKNDGWDSSIAVKKRVIKTDYRFDNLCSDEVTTECYQINGAKFAFDTPKNSSENLLFCTAGDYVRSDGGITPITAIWLNAYDSFDEWDGEKIPNATIRQGAFILNVDGELWIYEKSENVEFQNDRDDSDFFWGRNVLDTEYYELLEFNEGWNLVSDLNQNNPFDQYTNSFAKFTNGYFKFKIKDCEFDFLAVRNFRSDTFTIDALDANDNVLSSNNFSVDFNKPETFIHLDPENRELLTDNCTLNKYRGDFQFVFDQLHPSSHSVKLTFNGETQLGALFLGKREKLSCVSRDIQVKYKDFKTASINEITQTKSINISEDRLKTTTMTLNFTTHEEALVWLTYLARESYHISYFDSSQATGLSLLSHGGFIEVPEVKNKMRAVFFKLNEYNNA